MSSATGAVQRGACNTGLMLAPAVISTTFIVVGVLVVLLLAGSYGMKTYRGSTINAHPDDDVSAPGSADPSEPTGQGRIPEDPDSASDITTRGTR